MRQPLSAERSVSRINLTNLCLLSDDPDQWPKTVRDIPGLARSQHSRAG